MKREKKIKRAGGGEACNEKVSILGIFRISWIFYLCHRKLSIRFVYLSNM